VLWHREAYTDPNRCHEERSGRRSHKPLNEALNKFPCNRRVAIDAMENFRLVTVLPLESSITDLTSVQVVRADVQPPFDALS
jgi:hypothetical protein